MPAQAGTGMTDTMDLLPKKHKIMNRVHLFRPKKRHIWPFVLLIIAAIGIISLIIGCEGGCSFQKEKDSVLAEENNGILPKVKIIDLSKENGDELFIHFTGVVEPQAEVNIVALVPGQVISLNAEVGDTVIRGEVLSLLDNQEIATQFGTSQTNVINAREQLITTRLTTSAQVSQALLGVKNAELGVALQEEALLNTRASNTQEIKAATRAGASN